MRLSILCSLGKCKPLRFFALFVLSRAGSRRNVFVPFVLLCDLVLFVLA